MNSSNDLSKYIQRLVRAISEKERLIDQLKRQSKVSSLPQSQEENNSIVQEELRSELKQMSNEVKDLVEKMEIMEVQIQQLSSGLCEETKANQQLRKTISDNEQRQKTLIIKITYLQEQLKKAKQYEQLYKVTQQQLFLFKEEATSLHHKVKQQQSNQLHYFTSIIERHESEQLLIRQTIGTIYNRLKLYPYTKTTQDDPHTQKTAFEIMQEELKHIDQYIREGQSDQGNVLNQTLGDISIIMKSFEEKLENVHCLTKRENNSNKNNQDNHGRLKQTTRSVPVSSKLCLDFILQKENGIDRASIERVFD